MTAAITDADRLAAARLLIGEKVGGGDGQTYALKTPNYRDTEQAFAAHRIQARKEAIEEAATAAHDAIFDLAMENNERPPAAWSYAAVSAIRALTTD